VAVNRNFISWCLCAGESGQSSWRSS